MLRSTLARLAQVRDVRLARRSSPLLSTDDLEPEFHELYRRCKPYTMTSITRMYALYQAVQYVSATGIGGAVVECGVWRGGSAMLAALALQRLGDTGRELFLYDTYAGMTKPGDLDVDQSSAPALTTWRKLQRGTNNDWCYAPLGDVRRNMASTGYPSDKVRFVVGRVEDTVPDQAPSTIAVLRLDTDWYESTKHELVHLYPRLATNGVLIIDDYGYWQGARKAVDEYFSGLPKPVLMHRVDATGRMLTKPG